MAVVAKVSLSPSPQRQGHTNCSTSGLPQTFPQRRLPSIERALLASRRTEPVSPRAAFWFDFLVFTAQKSDARKLTTHVAELLENRALASGAGTGARAAGAVPMAHRYMGQVARGRSGERVADISTRVGGLARSRRRSLGGKNAASVAAKTQAGCMDWMGDGGRPAASQLAERRRVRPVRLWTAGLCGQRAQRGCHQVGAGKLLKCTPSLRPRRLPAHTLCPGHPWRPHRRRWRRLLTLNVSGRDRSRVNPG